ncbi:hypothetical protein N7495_004539 [Penicillium taxi]|uniref:uncharacterized protein n=1 Tax=Penicillium taxi TaxID=168475 RepID=UPI0025459D73|nr:uncharacterized protein N7495_004539 [Penicillium taxi]KAJ5899795.1 hypothetical protein N7495_004539 [Penicillium taxi]
MEDNDDDYFSDDFDSLPPATLFELEQSAWQASQAPATQQYVQQVINNTVLPAGVSAQRSEALKQPPRLHTGLTNDYDTLEVGELEAEVHGSLNGLLAVPQSRHILVAAEDNAWPVNGGMNDTMEIDDYTQGHARLKQLERENDQIQLELAEAKQLIETKTGEIAIIRAKQTRVMEGYDQQLAVLRKTLADEAAKHKQEVEAATAEGKMLATENIFLQQDLAEEAHQLRAFKQRQQNDGKNLPVTPRKSRLLSFRDGFDDEEMAAVSPSKSASRSRRATSVVSGKRKRHPSQDSATRLQLSPAADRMIVDPTPVNISGFSNQRELVQGDLKDCQLMKRLLNHRMVPNQETDIESMGTVYFPSEPTRPIARIVLENMAALTMGSCVVEYMHTIGPLWQRALTERFYAPVPRFAAIVRSVLAIPEVPFSELVTPLVPALQDCVEVNAVPRFKYSPAARDKARSIRQTPQSDLQPTVNSTDAMRLLYHIACELLHIKAALDSFWRNMRHTFVLLMLHGSQVLDDIVLVVHLLSTSIRPDSFGPIMSSDVEQIDVQKWIVNRLTFMLSEPVQPDEGMQPYTSHDICAMRLEVLLLLELLAFNPAAPSREHGSIIIATHPTSLARLFRSMHDELDVLYSSPPEQELRVSLINGMMRLIFGIMRRHGNSINLSEKLAGIPGGKQKHLVVLTRLAFCDGTVLEAGIDDETVDMAHELLEEWTNPQEAESLAEAFPSSRRD